MKRDVLPAVSERQSGGRELVVLVHGLSAKRLVMWPVARWLRKEGYRALNWGYRSTTRSIAWHGRELADLLERLEALEGTEGRAGPERIHLVGHSMGAIVVRAALLERPLRRLGRVVMLAPPNSGSHVARRIAPAVRWFCPTMAELGDAPDSFVNRLDPRLECEFGILAASRDRVVRRSSTWLQGASDWMEIPSHHGVLPWHRETARQVGYFLRHGRFFRAAGPAPGQ